MKTPLLVSATLVGITLLGCGQDTPTPARQTSGDASATPLEVVNRRMSAYNEHDLPAFLDTYVNDVEIREYSGRSLGAGREHMRNLFEPMFEEGLVHVVVQHQIVKDSYVVNHETVTDADSTTEYVSIYEVRDGLIQSVGFVRD
jgi:hypothetical protein